jgi:aryl-alcohol dehydrogenase-like predicted oxidoreductase
LYFCHRPDPNTPVEETVRAMSDLITQGKVLYWGTSEWSAAQITEAYEAARAYGLVPPTMEQPQYNMIFRENVEHQLLPLYERIGLGLTTFSPLCSGVLTGKYSDGIPPGTRISLDEMDWMRDKIRDEEGKAVIETTVRLSKIARELGISMPKMAVAWCLKNPHVSSVILGASKPAQLTETLESIDLLDLLSPGVMAEIDQVLNA